MDLKLVSILLTVSFLNGGKSIICVDKQDVFFVKAIVNRHRNGQGRNISENLYVLKNVAVIDVTQAQLPYLCEGMITDFPKLEVFSLINVNLSKIQPNVFRNVPNLKQLSLAVNHLMNIPAGSFNNLPSLETLYLSDNEISFIEENAFGNLVNLKAVHLDRNKLTEINGNVFKGCHLINLINYNFNVIKRIPEEALKGLKPTHHNPIIIFLNNNRINEVDALILDTTNALNIYLIGNEITKFSRLIFSLKEGSSLYLNKNKIECVSDDVLETMRNTSKNLHLSDNPITCDCLDRMENMLQRIDGQGQLSYTRTISDRLSCLRLSEA